MELFPIHTKRLVEGFNIEKELIKAIREQGLKLKEGDIIVISSKVLAVSQGRVVNLKDIKPSKRAITLKRTRYGRGKEDPRVCELVLRESDVVLPGTMLLAMKDGILIPEAGIDLSNMPKGFAVLWPKNTWKSTRNLWSNLKKTLGLKKLGIIICDSHCQPLRWGVVGLAIAWMGIEGVEDARGQKDIYGTTLKVTRKGVADNLASGAMSLMGEAGEKIPFVLIRNSPAKFTNRIQKKSEIFLEPKNCLFYGIYNKKFINLLKSK